MNRGVLKCAAAIVTIAVVPGLCRAMLRSTTIEALTRESSVIVLGRVADIVEIRGIQVARLQSERVLKGDVEVDLYFLAEGTWSCDISDAHEGEYGLYFFSPYKFSEHPQPPLEGTGDDEREYFGFVEIAGFRDDVVAMAAGRPLYQLTHSGCGRLVARDVGEVKHLAYSHVGVPQEFEEVKYSKAKDGFDRSAPLTEIVSYVLALVADRQPPSSTEPAPGAAEQSHAAEPAQRSSVDPDTTVAPAR
jgi:hypothetical protein